MESWYRHEGDNTSQGLIDLGRQIDISKMKIIVEIGSADGGSAVHWAQMAPGAQILCVDPWQEGTGYGEDIFQSFLEHTKPYPNITYLRRKADATVEGFFTRRSIDFLYLDAEHTFPAMRDYLRLLTHKVRFGGWIGGHDYAKEYPGVMRAVDEYGQKPLYTFCDTSFAYQVAL